MATGYRIDFTDQNLNRSFELAPFTTNGPVTPNDESLDSRATDAASTLLLYGKGAPDYGERIQENMLHQLENFANDVEPAYPVHGQFWLDTSVSPAQMRLYNAFKYTVVAADPPNDSSNNWFAITPSTPEDEAAQVARFIVNKKVTVIDDPSTHNKERYSVTTTAVVNGSSNVEFAVTPTPATPRNGWYIGGWEYMHHTNAVLRDDWILTPTPTDPTSWTITQVRDPINTYDIANKNYVDTEIATAIAATNELSELNDVTFTTAPVNQEILMHNGAVWTNVPIVDAIVPLSGTGSSSMTGDIDMGGNRIFNLPLGTPLTASDAPSRQYVDDSIASLGGSVPTILNDLADVTMAGPVLQDVLYYNGAQWTNIAPATWAAANDIVMETVSPTFTVPVYVPAIPPVANNELANKKYVDDEIAIGILAAGDGVINSLTFDNGSKDLEITTTIGGLFTVNLAGAAGGSDDFTHEILNPNQNPLDFGPLILGHALENTHYQDTSYPDIPVDKVIREFSVTLGRHANPNPRLVLTVDNAAGTIVNMVNTDLGATQCHAPISYAALMPYVVGMNRLSVFVNGQKYIADEFGVVHVLGKDMSGGTEIILTHGMETGLLPATDYDIDVNVNGTGFTTYTIDSDDAFRLGDMVDALNVVGAAASPQWSCILYEGILHFYSGTSGTGSSIDVTNGSGANPDLIAGVVGNAGTTGTIFIDLAENIFNFTTPTDYGFKEGSTGSPGLVGFENNTFTFNSTLPLNAVIEVVIEIDLYNRN